MRTLILYCQTEGGKQSKDCLRVVDEAPHRITVVTHNGKEDRIGPTVYLTHRQIQKLRDYLTTWLGDETAGLWTEED